MGLVGLSAARARTQTGLLFSLSAVVFVIALVVTVLAGYLSIALTVGVRSELAATPLPDSTAMLATRLAADPDAQAEAAQGILNRNVIDAGGTIAQTVQTDPLPLGRADGSEIEASIVVGADDTDAVAITGRRPAPTPAGAAVEGMLRGDAAGVLGIQTGDELVVSGVPVRITALWQGTDADALRWFSDPAPAVESSSVLGPLLVPPQAIDRFGTTPFVLWMIAPDVARTTADSLQQLAAGVTATASAFEASEAIGASGVVRTGRLDATAGRIGETVGAVSSVFPVAFILIAVVCILLLWQFLRLIAAVRIPEDSLLRARGASLRQFGEAAVVEGLAIGVPAAAAGSLLAVAGLNVVFVEGASIPARLPLLACGAVIVAVAILHAAATWLAALRSLARTTSESTGRRATPFIASGAFVVLAAVAGLAIWRLRTGSGVSGVDAFLVAGPSLGLLVLCLTGLVLVAWTTAGLDRALSRRTTGLAFSLPIRQVSRRLPLFAAASIAVMLVAGGGTLASAFSSVAATVQDVDGELANGADVRIVQPHPGAIGQTTVLEPTSAYGSLDDVDRAVPVRSDRLTIGSDDDVSLISAPAGALSEVMTDADGRIDVAAAAAALDGSPTGVALPADGRSLAITVAVSTGAAATERTALTLGLAAWVRDADGELSVLPSSDIVVTPGTTLGAAPRFTLPPRVAELVAIDVRTLSERTVPITIDVVAASVDGQPLVLGAGWTVAQFVPGLAESTPSAAVGFSSTVRGSLSGELRRLLPTFADTDPAVPAVVSAALATRLGVDIGDEFEGRFDGTGRVLGFRVVGRLADVPGATSGRAILVDLAAVEQRFLVDDTVVPQTNQVWLSSRSPERLAGVLERAAAPGVVVTTAQPGGGGALVRSATDALWIGAIGAGVLAVIAFVATALSLAGVRRPEIALLSRLGISGRSQGRLRLIEFVVVVVLSVLLGLAAGAVIAALTVDTLVGAALPGSSGVGFELGFQPAPLLVLVAATIILVAIVGVIAATGVRREARPARGAEAAS